MYSEFVESLKRLYNNENQRISKEKVNSLLEKKKINEEEYLYILGGKS